jgi:hypothetical protein
MNKFIKIAVINLVLLFFLILVIELILGHYSVRNVSIRNSACGNIITNYSYCNDITFIKYMNVKDRFFPVSDYINKYGYSYDPKGGFSGEIDKSNVFLIGDSFIQAEEMEINKRMGAQLRKTGIKAMEIGFGSWNPFQYERILKSVHFPERSTFFIFLMTNDFTPGYYRSYVRTKPDIAYPFKRKELSFFEELENRSFFINAFQRISLRLNKKKENQKIYINNSHNRKNLNQCSQIEKFRNKKLLSYDYLVFSKSHLCWPKETLKGVDKTIASLNRMSTIVKKKNGKLHFLLIPAGFSFKNENTVGRLAASHYGIKKDIEVKHFGLADYVKRNIEADFYDLTDELEQIKQSEGKNLIDLLYFPVDGHWREFTHRKISKFVRDILSRKN